MPRHRRSISLVPVLPTLPVTATMRALLRARAARPIPSSARRGSSTRSNAPLEPEPLRAYLRETMAAAAPALNAAGTNSWPSRASFRATNTSPGSRLRVSMEKPVTRSAGAPSASPCVAATRSSHCHSGSAIDGRLRQRGPHRLVIREGQDGGADDLPGLVALAGDEQQIAVAEQSRAGADGLGAVADLARAGAPARISARMVSGRSLRGLSSVTMT